MFLREKQIVSEYNVDAKQIEYKRIISEYSAIYVVIFRKWCRIIAIDVCTLHPILYIISIS